MIVDEFTAILTQRYGPALKHIQSATVKHPTFTLDLMELLDSDPSAGFLLLTNFCQHFQDLFQSILLSQYLLTGKVFNTFTLNLTNSPYITSNLSQISKSCNKFITVFPVYITSLSKTSSFVSISEFTCHTCCQNFSFATDLSWGKLQQQPTKCYAVINKDIPRCREREVEECLGTSFDLQVESVVYSDFQEFTASDGKSEISGIVQGNLCDSCKVGDVVEISGIFTQRWLNCEAEYSFITFDLVRKESSLVKVGLEALNYSLEKKNDFEIREIIIRSSFGAVFGNYHVKFALLLNILAHLCGVTFSTLIQGEISTGKSTLATCLVSLFPDQCKLLNGVLTSSKIFQSSRILNLSSGKSESGFLHSSDILVIDNFKALPDKRVVLKAMEDRSIIALLETETDFDLGDLNKACKLVSDFDKFDVILNMKNCDRSNQFVVKKLGNCQYEEFDDLWDFDSIKGYIFSKVRSHKEIKIVSDNVELLLEKFIEYTVTSNMKNCEMPVAAGMSVRLLESLIKVAKLNAILLNHNEITVFDALDAILLLKFPENPEIFTNLSVYESTVHNLLSQIEDLCGPLNSFS